MTAVAWPAVVWPAVAWPVVAWPVVVRRRVRVIASVASVVTAPALVHVAVASTVPSASHAIVVCCEMMSVIVRPSSVCVPGVSAAVGVVASWIAIVVVMAVRIVSIDAEMPEAVAPIERTIEVFQSAESAILPVKEYVRQVEVTACPIYRIYIIDCVDAHEIVEVHFKSGLILFFREVEFVRHLICEEEGLVSCLLIRHSLCRECCEHQNECE